jgi:hypothetical protein
MQSEAGFPSSDLRKIYILYSSQPSQPIPFTTKSKNMPTSVWNKQTFSIATDELSTLTRDEFTTVMGSLVIDLVSAPITPGTYDIRLTAVMGGIQIFLPAYAKVLLNGETFWGSKRIYHGEAFWKEMREAFANSTIQVPTTLPVWATASHKEYPVALRFTINTTMGGAHIYQLDPTSIEGKYVSQSDV